MLNDTGPASLYRKRYLDGFETVSFISIPLKETPYSQPEKLEIERSKEFERSIKFEKLVATAATSGISQFKGSGISKESGKSLVAAKSPNLSQPKIGISKKFRKSLATPPGCLSQSTRFGISEKNLVAATTPGLSLDTTADTSPCFTCFLRLPPEVRSIIIDLALSEPRYVRLSYPWGRRCRSCRLRLGSKESDVRGPSPPAIMQVNRLFRYEALKAYPLSFPLCVNGIWTEPRIRFNFSVDTLIIPQHIVDEEETLPDENWKRLQRVGIICEDDFLERATERLELLESMMEPIKIFPKTHPCDDEDEDRHYSIPFSMDSCKEELEYILSESPIRNELQFEYWTEEKTWWLMEKVLPPIPPLSPAMITMRARMYRYLTSRNSELSAT